MDRQARLAEFGNKEWTSFGDVTHVEAARLYASSFVMIGMAPHTPFLVETRDQESPNVTYEHRVRVTKQIEVTPLRTDE